MSGDSGSDVAGAAGSTARRAAGRRSHKKANRAAGGRSRKKARSAGDGSDDMQDEPAESMCFLCEADSSSKVVKRFKGKLFCEASCWNALRARRRLCNQAEDFVRRGSL